MNEENIVNTPTESSPAATAKPAKISFSDVLDQAWELCKTKLWGLIGIDFIMLISMAVALIIAMIPVGILVGIAISVKIPSLVVVAAGISLIALMAVLIWIASWGMVSSIMYLAGQHNTVRTAMQAAWPKTKQLLPTIYLYTLATLGGYLLFVIPGIVMSISLMFVVLVAVLEDKTMYEALKRSRELVVGRWWNLFWISVLYFVALILLSVMTGYNYSPIAIIITSLTYVVMFVLYQQATSRGPVKTVNRSTWYYQLAAVIAILAFIAGIAGAATAVGNDWDKFTEKFKEAASQKSESNKKQNKNDSRNNNWLQPDTFYDDTSLINPEI